MYINIDCEKDNQLPYKLSAELLHEETVLFFVYQRRKEKRVANKVNEGGFYTYNFKLLIWYNRSYKERQSS